MVKKDMVDLSLHATGVFTVGFPSSWPGCGGEGGGGPPAFISLGFYSGFSYLVCRMR